MRSCLLKNKKEKKKKDVYSKNYRLFVNVEVESLRLAKVR